MVDFYFNINFAGGHCRVADVAADSGAGSDKGLGLEGAKLDPGIGFRV